MLVLVWYSVDSVDRELTETLVSLFVFQKTTLFSMHLVGAVLTFGVGALYIGVQTLISSKMQPHINSKSIYLIRLGVGVWTMSSIISSILPQRQS